MSSTARSRWASHALPQENVSPSSCPLISSADPLVSSPALSSPSLSPTPLPSSAQPSTSTSTFTTSLAAPYESAHKDTPPMGDGAAMCYSSGMDGYQDGEAPLPRPSELDTSDAFGICHVNDTSASASFVPRRAGDSSSGSDGDSDGGTTSEVATDDKESVMLSAAQKYKFNSTSTVMTARSTLAMPETHELLLTVATVIHCQLLADAAEQVPVSSIPSRHPGSFHVHYIPVYDIAARSDTYGAGQQSFGWEWNEAVILHKQTEEWREAQRDKARQDATLSAGMSALTLDRSKEKGKEVRHETEMNALPETSDAHSGMDITVAAQSVAPVKGAFLENVGMLAKLPQMLPSITEADDDSSGTPTSGRMEVFFNASGLTPLVDSARKILGGPVVDPATLASDGGDASSDSHVSGHKRTRTPESDGVKAEEESAARYAQFLGAAIQDLDCSHPNKRMRAMEAAATNAVSESGAAIVVAPSPMMEGDKMPSGPPLPPFPAAAGEQPQAPVPHLVSMIVPPLPEVFNFLQALTLTARFSPQCNLIALIYLNRLVAATGIALHSGNWRPLVLVALLLAQKVWDDRSLSSRDFAILCPLFTPATIRRLERKFLLGLKYQVDVSQGLYAQYYFELRSLSSELTPSSFPLQPLSAAEARRLEVRSSIGKRLPSFATLRGVRRASGTNYASSSTPMNTPAMSSSSSALDLAMSPAMGQALYTPSAAKSRFVLS